MKIMSYIRIIYKIISAICYYALTILIPKRNNLWVFGSWKGKNFSDNAKELYLYVNKHHKDIDAVWIAKNQKVYDEVSHLGYNVVLYSSLKAKWLVARAKANIQTESNEDTGSYRVGGTKVIQLFHGYGAVKEAHLYPDMSDLKKSIVKIYSDNHTTSYWMVPSDYFYDRLPVLFDTDKRRMFITGQPRIDLLFAKREQKYFESYKDKYPGYKFIFYAPTHRNYALSDKIDFTNEDWDFFNKYCISHKYICFFKPHPLELYKYQDSFNSFSNIILLSNKVAECPNDPYEYMHYFDLIISDYSSISTDFLVFDRPVVHFMYDIDNYETSSFTLRALDTFKAGPICKTWKEMFYEIENSLTNDPYKDLRNKARKVAFKYVDNKNCERVYNQIVKLLG